MPDKRDMHQAKSHRNSKNPSGKARGQAPLPSGSAAPLGMDDTQLIPLLTNQPSGKNNQRKH